MGWKCCMLIAVVLTACGPEVVPDGNGTGGESGSGSTCGAEMCATEGSDATLDGSSMADSSSGSGTGSPSNELLPCDDDAAATAIVGPIDGIGTIASLQFLAVDGGDHLAIVQPDSVSILRIPIAGGPQLIYTDEGGELFAVVGGDYDGEGERDILVAGASRQGTIQILAGDGNGAFTPAFSLSGSGHRQKLLAARWSFGDDLVELRQSGTVEATTFSNLKTSGTYSTPIPYEDIAVGAFAVGGADELVGLLAAELHFYDEAENPWNAADVVPLAIAPDGVASGRFDGAEPLVAAYQRSGDGSLAVEVLDRARSFAPVAFPSAAASVAVGDLDGDGADDLVTATATTLVVAMGGGEPFTCYRELTLDASATIASTGDLDGDGRDELALSDGASLSIVALD